MQFCFIFLFDLNVLHGLLFGFVMFCLHIYNFRIEIYTRKWYICHALEWFIIFIFGLCTFSVETEIFRPLNCEG